MRRVAYFLGEQVSLARATHTSDQKGLRLMRPIEGLRLVHAVVFTQSRAMTLRSDLGQIIAQAKTVVAFTGAGISTESGIPDFRSPGGVWSQMKPIQFQDFISDPDQRREAWRRVFSGRAGWTGRVPNEGHLALARLAAQGKLSHVITQNVDNLHQASGLRPEQVIELHGNASYATCLTCAKPFALEDLRADFMASEAPPTCTQCGGWVKSATISFGQPMPKISMTRATRATLDCDLFLVLGSSLLVYPAAGFPLLAKRNGAALVIVNREPTDLDPYADLVLRDEIGVTLSEIID